MAQPFKDVYNHSMVSELARQLQRVHAEFDSVGFINTVIDDRWEQRELKSRMRHISLSLGGFLPKDYDKAINILQPVSCCFRDLPHMVFPDFVECFGLEQFDLSVQTLELFTQYSSSEFAVRPFILKTPAKMMQQMRRWAKSSNEHVRRLASEGCRPRLPWAMALPVFKQDPQPVLKILSLLLNDESEYVRKSVANNLNDISKDNPQVLLQLLRTHLGKASGSDWVLKH